jgi:glycosyltransferase involved in cell wall biosynthesis
MKIAIVVNSAWAAYNFRSNLATGFEYAGYEVIFVIPYDGNYSKKLQEKFQCYDLYLNAKSLNPMQDIKTLISLFNIYKRADPDIVCHFTIKPNIYGSIAARTLGMPSINNITGLGTLFIRKSLATYVAKLLYRLALSFSNLVFFQNIQDQKYFLDNKLVRKSKSRLIPGSGVDLERFKPFKPIIKKGKFVFLLIARLLRDKGVYEFIDAIRMIKKNYPEILLEFQILGEVGADNRTAIQKSELEGWIKDDLVKYLGVSDKVERVIAQCDCVVLPSYREGMPRSVLEAFAMEKPVIVSDVPGCVDIVDHQVNGLICKVKSSRDLAEKMVNMFSMSEKMRQEMGLNGRSKVVNFFDEKIIIDAYIKSINHIINNEKIV